MDHQGRPAAAARAAISQTATGRVIAVLRGSAEEPAAGVAEHQDAARFGFGSGSGLPSIAVTAPGGTATCSRAPGTRRLDAAEWLPWLSARPWRH
jgi:hypothetical protein